MQHKIDKNYLGEALKHFDVNNNQIIDFEEWAAFFQQDSDPINIWKNAKFLIARILQDIFPNENPERLPILAEAILMNHSTDSPIGREIDIKKLYSYVVRFIAPQKYRSYQQQLKDKTQFFLYDGVIEQYELNIFTDDNNRLMTADVYYLIVSYHIDPIVALEMIAHLITLPEVQFNPDDFTLDAYGVFDVLAVEKYGDKIIDIDALLDFANRFDINQEVDYVFSLFGIHNDIAKTILETGEVNYDVVYVFLNFHNRTYLELGLKSLLDTLKIELQDTHTMLRLIEFLGYVGKPHKIFREIAGDNYIFTSKEMQQFLQDNQIAFKLGA